MSHISSSREDNSCSNFGFMNSQSSWGHRMENKKQRWHNGINKVFIGTVIEKLIIFA